MDRRARALLLGCALAMGCMAAMGSALAIGCAAEPPAPAARARADADYRRGIALLAEGKPAAAREALRAAAAVAPIDPALYLPLARACRDRLLVERAAGFYRKFLAAAPVGADADAARAELAALGDDVAPLLDEPPRTAWPAATTVGWAALAVVLLAGAGALAWTRLRRRGRTLSELAAENPELQPAIAYLVGCLRHELLKHRILAVGDAARALANGAAHAGERQFLLARLYGGEPLRVAWAGHLGAFMRALGPRFDLLRHDPLFRDADRAIASIAGGESALRRDDRDAWAQLARAHARLTALDGALGALATRLQNTVIDDALLGEVVAATQRELGPRGAVDEVTVAPVPPGIAVELYRLDLLLVLKNVVRNALAAAAAGPAPRRVAIEVAVDVEPTGEEIVRVCVRDTNPTPLPATAPATRGLGLVTTALARCDGSLAVEDGGAGWAKAVVVRLFRALSAAAEAA